jgi:hypothetical protein
MRKKTLGLALGAAMLLSVAAPAAAMADTVTVPTGTTTTVNTLPNVATAFATFDQGGADLGRGVAELLSGALIGAPQLVTALPCELAGANAPARCAYAG